MTGFHTFLPAIFHACHLAQAPDRGGYQLLDATDTVRTDGWRIDVGYPEDCDRAEKLFAEAVGDGGDGEWSKTLGNS